MFSYHSPRGGRYQTRKAKGLKRRWPWLEPLEDRIQLSGLQVLDIEPPLNSLLRIQYSGPVQAELAADPSHYRLIGLDQQRIELGEGTYDPETFTASFLIQDGGPLPAGAYQVEIQADAILGLQGETLTGDPDLAITAGRTIAIRRNLGGGEFRTVTTLDVLPADPSSLAAADLDGDGEQDLLAVVETRNQGFVFLGQGEGVYADPVGLQVGETPLDLALGDINGDGAIDVVTANLFGDATVLLNDGSGLEFDRLDVPIGSRVKDVVVHDFDWDGRDDIALSVENMGVVILSEFADGTFTRTEVFEVPAGGGLSPGDVNGDGLLDLVVASPPGRALGVLYADSTPGGFLPVTYPLGSSISPSQTVVQSEGVLAYVDASARTVNMVRVNEDGSQILLSPLSTMQRPTAVQTADLDHDGLLEVLVSTTSDQQRDTLMVFEATDDVLRLRSTVGSGLPGGATGFVLAELDSWTRVGGFSVEASPLTVRDDAYETSPGRSLVVEGPGLFANDDLPAGVVSLLLVQPPEHGVLELDDQGGFVYTPDPAFRGEDHFVYRAQAAGESGEATVTITVQPSDDNPLPGEVLLEDHFDGPLDLDVWKVDTNISRGPASVVVANGQVQFVNRGHLITREEFDPKQTPLAIEGVWTFLAGSGPARDFFQLLTRSDGLPGGGTGETQNGVEFHATPFGFISIELWIDGTSTRLADAVMPIDNGIPYHFRITDDGDRVTFSFGVLGGDQTTIEADCAQEFASNHVVFHNRENNNGSWTRSHLDDVVIRTLPRPDIQVQIEGETSVDEGSEYLLGLVGADTSYIQGWELDWGDGTSEWIEGNPSSVGHTYADGLARFLIQATAWLEDGTSRSAESLEITVLDVAPTLTLEGEEAVEEGGLYTLYVNLADPGDEIVTATTIDWGDGTVETFEGLPEVLGHVYTNGPGERVITAIASDEEGDHEVLEPLVVDVSNVAPSQLALTLSSTVIQEGGSVLLSGRFRDPGVEDAHTVRIDWGDGVVNTLRLQPEIADFTATHRYLDNAVGGSHLIRVMVLDDDGGEGQAETALSVRNVAPQVSLAGRTDSVRGQPLSFVLSTRDVSPIDLAAGLRALIDWGDGVRQELVTRDPLVVEHIYTTAGAFHIRVTAIDKDGGVRALVRPLRIRGVQAQGGALVVGGTTGSDRIVLAPAGRRAVRVTINGVLLGTFGSLARIQVYAQAGNDVVQVGAAVTLLTEIYGAEGNDTLWGGRGNNLLDGGAGHDVLLGGGNRDLLVGGEGSDTLSGQGSDDLLIGGSFQPDTPFGVRRAALLAVLGRWARPDGYASRVAALEGGLAAQVQEDAESDILAGNAGRDWFFANLTAEVVDALRDRTSLEVLTDLNRARARGWR